MSDIYRSCWVLTLGSVLGLLRPERVFLGLMDLLFQVEGEGMFCHFVLSLNFNVVPLAGVVVRSFDALCAELERLRAVICSNLVGWNSAAQGRIDVTL